MLVYRASILCIVLYPEETRTNYTRGSQPCSWESMEQNSKLGIYKSILRTLENILLQMYVVVFRFLSLMIYIVQTKQINE